MEAVRVLIQKAIEYYHQSWRRRNDIKFGDFQTSTELLQKNLLNKIKHRYKKHPDNFNNMEEIFVKELFKWKIES